jgi:hypothetical protein
VKTVFDKLRERIRMQQAERESERFWKKISKLKPLPDEPDFRRRR